jgi:hypothetical protein
VAADRVPGPLTLAEDDRRIVAVWAADCAERVLPLFEARSPDDPRARQAIDGVRAFARGELRIGPVRALSAAAHAAARDAHEPAAIAAARAAGHAAGTAHMAAHARGAPAYATLAISLAWPEDPETASREIVWQLDHATPDVRDILCRLPEPQRGGGRLGELIRILHDRMMASSGRE